MPWGVAAAAVAAGGAYLASENSADAMQDAADSAAPQFFDIGRTTTVDPVTGEATTGGSGGTLGSVRDSGDNYLDPVTGQVRSTNEGKNINFQGNQSLLDTFDQLGQSNAVNFNQIQRLNDATQRAGIGLAGNFSQAQTDVNQQFLGLQNAENRFQETIDPLRSMATQGQGAALGTLSGPGRVDASAQQSINQGLGLTQGDSQGVVDSTLANLRARAQTGNERQVNSRIQDLFSRGTLSSTSGARALGELQQAQDQQDLGFQLAAEQAGLSRFGANQQAGQGLLSIGQQGMLAGQQGNISQGSVQNQIGQGGFNNLQGLNESQLASVQRGATAQGQGGLARLGLVQDMFGFGQAGQAAGLNNVLGGLGGQTNINTDTRNTIALASNSGANMANTVGAQIMAGAPNGTSAAISGFSSGLADALSNI